MSAVQAVRFGANAGGSDDTSLFLKMYSGTFNEAFRSATYLWDTNLPVIARKNVTSGKSWQFLMMGDLPAPEDFTPGDELLGQGYSVEEGTISVDKYLVAHNFVPRDQMQLSHFEILPRLARSHAKRIGRLYDGRLFALAALSARSSANTNVTKNGILIHGGGNRVTRDTNGQVGLATVTGHWSADATGAAAMRADLRSMALLQDIDNIPPGERYIWFRPEARNVALFDNTAQLFSGDYVHNGNDIQSRALPEIEGYKVMGFPNAVSNNGPFPNTNVSTGLSKYQGNFTTGVSNGVPLAIALSPTEDGGAPIGVVTFESVQQVVQYYPEKMSWLVMSFVLCGADIMNPWGAASVEGIDS